VEVCLTAITHGEESGYEDEIRKETESQNDEEVGV
jgi:hypothetical protein